MKRHAIIRWLLAISAMGLNLLLPSATAAGKYTLAFWREAGAYENQAPPAGAMGNHSAHVHVWDENGVPLAGKQIYTSWGVLLGATDSDGYTEIVLNRPNGYDFQIRDGAHLTDTTPVLSVERPPTWGHYSFEVGFMFKQNAANPGTFDTSYDGIVNASGDDPCLNLSAPRTRSLAYYSTDPNNYCSDAYTLGNWAPSHGQTFVATGNRIVGLKAYMAAGTNHFYWTAQILEGGPNGTPVGPPRTTRLLAELEFYQVLVKWGINDVQVVPGRTYYFRITRAQGINAWHVGSNNYLAGDYYEDDAPVPGVDLMGLVVCAGYTNSGPTGTLTGSVRDPASNPLTGAQVTIADAGLYATTDKGGNYTIPLVPAGTYDVTASKDGYLGMMNSGVVIIAGQTNSSDFTLTPQPTNTGPGIVTNGSSILQPFEIPVSWDSTFDASWGGPATFSIVAGGQTSNALQVARGGAGSSARVQVYPLRTNTPYQLSIWIRCPSFSASYWAECAYRLGNFTAQDFDANSGAWTYVKKFNNSSANGNGNTWTCYTTTFNSGANTQISVGFKLGAPTGPGPTVHWDELSLVSLMLPPPTFAVANSPSNIAVQFAEPVRESAATNAANYRLASLGGPVAVLSAALAGATNVLLVTDPQIPRAEHTLTVSNVTTVLQPANLTGRNGQITVRVPFPLIGIDDSTLWKYDQNGTNLGPGWRMPSYNDSSWPAGPALLGESGGPLPEPIRTALAVGTNTITYYFRRQFTLPPALTNTPLRLRAVVDDGAVFWLNGAELLRLGYNSPTYSYLACASRNVGIATYEGPFDLPGTRLLPGANLLAVEVHQAVATSPDVLFGATLEALVLPSQLPSANAMLAIAHQGESLSLSWSEPAMSLECATNVAGPWAPLGGASPVTVWATNEARFYRLRW